jgi:hypothetical protein
MKRTRAEPAFWAPRVARRARESKRDVRPHQWDAASERNESSRGNARRNPNGVLRQAPGVGGRGVSRVAPSISPRRAVTPRTSQQRTVGALLGRCLRPEGTRPYIQQMPRTWQMIQVGIAKDQAVESRKGAAPRGRCTQGPVPGTETSGDPLRAPCVPRTRTGPHRQI